MSGVAFLFPGQLSEFAGMGRDFYDADPEARSLFAKTSRLCGRDLERILYSSNSSPDELHENLTAQAAVYLISSLACRALARKGVFPSATAGYSLGNYAALVASRAVSYEEGLEVLIAVWRETEALGLRGSMAAVVGCRREVVEGVCQDLRRRGLPVWIGNVNSSTQFVLTGTSPAVTAALEALATRALSILPLPMSWPIHSELMAPVARAIEPAIQRLTSIRDPEVAYYGPEGTVIRSGDEVSRLLATEFVHPTLWNATFEAMVRDGFRTFVEVGPGVMLGRISRWIDRSVIVHEAGSDDAIGRAADILRLP